MRSYDGFILIYSKIFNIATSIGIDLNQPTFKIANRDSLSTNNRLQSSNNYFYKENLQSVRGHIWNSAKARILYLVQIICLVNNCMKTPSLLLETGPRQIQNILDKIIEKFAKVLKILLSYKKENHSRDNIHIMKYNKTRLF